MRYSIENKINPMTLVDDRYNLKLNTEKSKWKEIMNDFDAISDLIKENKEVPIENMTIESPKAEIFNDISQNEEIKKQALSRPVRNLKDNLTVMERYNLIMAEAKQIARVAANSEDKTKEIVEILKKKWKDYNLEKTANNEEVTEAISVKIGRPKLKRNKSCSEKKHQKNLLIAIFANL